MGEGVYVVDECRLVLHPSLHGAVKDEEVGKGGVNRRPDQRSAGKHQQHIDRVVSADPRAEGGRDPKIGPRRRHSVNQVVKSWIGARSVIRLFGTASGSAWPRA